MSSRIRADADGPGENAHRSSPEPVESDEPVSATPPAEEPVEAPERPQDAPAEGDDERSNAGGRQELPDEVRKRLDRLSFEGHQARRELAEARAQLAEMQRMQQAQQPQGPEKDAEERAYQRMQQERLQQDFNRDCDNLWQRGVNEYGDIEMQEAKRGVDAVGWGSRPDALAALTALPDGHRIYRELATDLDNAARILSLPPMRMAVELARMSRGETSLTANVSRETNREPIEDRRTRAPEPLRPVGGNSRRAEMRLDDPRMTIAEHIRQRDREQWGSSRIRR